MPAGATDVVLGQFSVVDGSHISSSRFGGSTPAMTGGVLSLGNLLDGSTASVIAPGFSNCDTTAAVPCTQIKWGLGLDSPGGGSGADGFVGRYSIATGIPTWLATLKGTTEDKIMGLTNGPNGTIYVAGFYSEGVGLSATLTSGANTRTFAGMGDRDILVAQLTPSTGAIGMTKIFAGPGFEQPDTIAWTGSEIVVAGTFAGGGTNFGIKTLPVVGGFDIWVAKLNPTDGSAVWAIPIASTADDKFPSIVVDAFGDIYVTGFVGAATNLGGFTIGGAGGLDIFVAKLRNSDGSVVWAKSLGSTGDDSPITGSTGCKTIAINAAGQIVISGIVSGPLQPGGPYNGGGDAVVASFSSDGISLWTRVLGTAGSDLAFGVAAGANAFYASMTLGAAIGATFDGEPVIGTAAPTGLLLKIVP
jgi:hypothetical protein